MEHRENRNEKIDMFVVCIDFHCQRYPQVMPPMLRDDLVRRLVAMKDPD
jgi:hypothetical protein